MTNLDRESSINAYGWTAVPRDLDELTKRHSTLNLTEPVQPIPISQIREIPKSKLSQDVYEYAQKELSKPTFHHSMRVFLYGQAILQTSFPSWISPPFIETYFLSCLLHDIGTTDKNIHSTLMSFEIYGAYVALDVLKREHAPVEQAECVAETIIRHQDIGTKGVLSRVAALIQLATIFDNMGGHPELIHTKTIEDVVALYPRLKWSSCFAATLREENALKPWSNSRRLGEKEFPEGVEGNKLMAPYDD